MKHILLIDRLTDRSRAMRAALTELPREEVKIYALEGDHFAYYAPESIPKWQPQAEPPRSADLILVHGRDKDLVEGISAPLVVWYGNQEGVDADQPHEPEHESIHRRISSSEGALELEEVKELIAYLDNRDVKPAFLMPPGERDKKLRTIIRVLESLMSIPHNNFNFETYRSEIEAFSKLADLSTEERGQVESYPAKIEQIPRNGNQVIYYRRVYDEIATLRDKLLHY